MARFITSPYLTRYEISNIIGMRAIKISNGEKPFIDISEVNPVKIATEELKAGFLGNYVIKRQLPNGEVEEIKISQLKIPPF